MQWLLIQLFSLYCVLNFISLMNWTLKNISHLERGRSSFLRNFHKLFHKWFIKIQFCSISFWMYSVWKYCPCSKGWHAVAVYSHLYSELPELLEADRMPAAPKEQYRLMVNTRALCTGTSFYCSIFTHFLKLNFAPLFSTTFL